MNEQELIKKVFSKGVLVDLDLKGLKINNQTFLILKGNLYIIMENPTFIFKYKDLSEEDKKYLLTECDLN